MYMSGVVVLMCVGACEGRDIGPSGSVARNGCELLDINTRNLSKIP